jgi:hypothetical protein
MMNFRNNNLKMDDIFYIYYSYADVKMIKYENDDVPMKSFHEYTSTRDIGLV